MVGVAQKIRPPKQKPSTAAPGITVKPKTATIVTPLAAPTTTVPTTTITPVVAPITISKPTTTTSNDLALMTKTQSLLIVKTMLEAAFGCVTYLRGLLPEDNFEDDFVGVPSTNSGGLGDSQSSAATSSQLGSKGIKTKRLIRGCSSEADKILNWMDGIMHAIERSYLKTCVFGIYLDPDEPENLIEALTISFHYPLIPGTSIPTPQMTISDSLSALDLKETGAECQNPALPSSQTQSTNASAIRLKTIGEVKRMIRGMIRSLNATCTGLEEIPARRFGTMKLVYNETAPEDYEPPHFVPLLDENKKWYFRTREEVEGPSRSALGYVETGYHSISIKMTSIVKQLPVPPDIMEEESMPFGTVAERAVSIVAEETKKRKLEDAMQREDAAKRRVIWSAEKDADERGDIDPSYRDAEGEPDEDISASQQSSTEYRPEGILRSDGTLRPIKRKPKSAKSGAKPQQEPHLTTITRSNTQPVPSSQRVEFPRPDRAPVGSTRTTETDEALSPTYVSKGNNAETVSPYDLAAMQAVLVGADDGNGVSQLQVEVEEMQVDGEAESLQAEAMDMLVEDPVTIQESSGMKLATELPESIQVDPIETNKEKADDADSIASFTQDDRVIATVQPNPTTAPISETLTSKRSTRQSKNTKKAEQSTKPSKPTQSRNNRPDPCVCGDANTDLTMVQCENCGCWSHLPCAGYLDPKNLPETYYCIECLLRLTGNDTKARIEHVGLYLPGIALMRRGLWIGYTEGEIKGEVEFAKRLGCGLQDVKTLIKRIVTEGFLVPVLSDTDRVAIDPNSKSHKKKSPVRKTAPAGFDPLNSPKGWLFVNDITHSNKLRIWFAPGGRIEKAEFGIDKKIVMAFKDWRGGPQLHLKQPGKELPDESQKMGLGSIREDQTQDSPPQPTRPAQEDPSNPNPEDEPMQIDISTAEQTPATTNQEKEPLQVPPTGSNNPDVPKEQKMTASKNRRRLFPTPSPSAIPGPTSAVKTTTRVTHQAEEGEEDQEEVQDLAPRNKLESSASKETRLHKKNQNQARNHDQTQDQHHLETGSKTQIPPPGKPTSILSSKQKDQVPPAQLTNHPTSTSTPTPTPTRRSERVSRARSVIDLCGTF